MSHDGWLTGDLTMTKDLSQALTEVRDQYGVTLAELSERAPTLVVFLRHFG